MKNSEHPVYTYQFSYVGYLNPVIKPNINGNVHININFYELWIFLDLSKMLTEVQVGTVYVSEEVKNYINVFNKWIKKIEQIRFILL